MISYTNDKKKLLVINAIMNIAFCFFNIFFNIYVYDISQNFNIVVFHSLTFILTIFITFSIIRKFLTQKIITTLFKLSFFLCLVCIMLTFTINKDRLYIAFFVQFLYGITCLFYYMPSELSAMYKNDSTQLKKFNGLNSSVAIISAILSPLISGFIIDFISYYILFIVIAICVVCSYFFAHNINLTNFEVEHCKLKDFFAEAKQHKEITYSYIGYGIKRLSNDGPVEKILFILLFLKTGQNYSVGIYSAIAALISGILLLVFVFLLKNSKIVFWLCSIFKFLSSILLLISNSIICFFIYYFINDITYKIITNESISHTFAIINHTRLTNNKVEHYYLTNMSSTIGLIIACILSLCIYNFMQTTFAMSIFIVITTAMQLLSSYFITKSRDMVKSTIEK